MDDLLSVVHEHSDPCRDPGEQPASKAANNEASTSEETSPLVSHTRQPVHSGLDKRLLQVCVARIQVSACTVDECVQIG